jgi:hypothetical protein
MLARWRVEHPELKQIVFRIGTILGETVRNQITDLFEKPRLLAIRGADSLRFHLDRTWSGPCRPLGARGIYNVAGDGAGNRGAPGKRCLTVGGVGCRRWLCHLPPSRWPSRLTLGLSVGTDNAA